MKLSSKDAILTVDAQAIADVLPFAAVENIRYYLNGVCIRPTSKGGVLVMATDGHSLYCVRDPYGKAPGEVILPVRKTQHSRHFKPDHTLFMDADQRIWATDRNGKAVWVSPTGPIEGKFPKIDALVGPLDQYDEGLQGTVQVPLLQRMLDAGHARSLRVYTERMKGDTPGKVLFVIDQNAFGIIMPMRGTPKLASVIPPEFMPAAPTREDTNAS